MKKTLSRIDYTNKEKVLEVKDLRISFKSDSGKVQAVRGVSFDLYKGETLCIVGESGSGKSVTSKTIMGILPVNSIIESGQILYDGEDLVRISEEEFHRIRGHKIGMIFQDPLSSLNPIMKVGKQIIEATMINRNVIKRKYNDLISKELINLRNEHANLIFEKLQINNEIDTLNKLNKDIKKKENTEIIKILENHFKNIDASTKFKIESINLELAGLLKKEDDNLIPLNNSIRDLKIEKLNNFISLISKHSNYLINFKLDDSDSLIRKRLEDLKEYKSFLVENYKMIKPHLTQALKERKRLAKAEILEYATELKNTRDEKIDVLKGKLQQILVKYEELKALLNEDELKKLNLMLNKNSNFFDFRKFFKKQDTTTGIAKAAKKEEKILSTGNKEFDEIYKAKLTIEEEINKVNEEYTSATKITKKEAERIALEVMKEVGIPLPEQRFKQYPFEFSGGMRQRIVIAIALTANPDILICDEPTTALDVTIQAQILELINKLKRERNLSCIFITHDLGVVANMADRVAVMYAGKIVEYGTSNEIFFEPKHPYTWALLSSIPDIDSKEKLESIPGTPPDMRFPPEGDAFALRSKYALAIDFKYEPPYFKISDTHYAATWLLHEDAPKVEMPKIVQTRIKNALKEVD